MRQTRSRKKEEKDELRRMRYGTSAISEPESGKNVGFVELFVRYNGKREIESEKRVRHERRKIEKEGEEKNERKKERKRQFHYIILLNKTYRVNIFVK